MSTALANQVAIVTGANQGIGEAIAKQLAADGAKTVVNFLSDTEQAEKVVAAITQAGGEAVAVQADLSDPAQIAALFEAAEKAFGPVTLLVNNAGARGDSALATKWTPKASTRFLRSTCAAPCCAWLSSPGASRPGASGSLISPPGRPGPPCRIPAFTPGPKGRWSR